MVGVVHSVDLLVGGVPARGAWLLLHRGSPREQLGACHLLAPSTSSHWALSVSGGGVGGGYWCTHRWAGECVCRFRGEGGVTSRVDVVLCFMVLCLCFCFAMIQFGHGVW